MISVHAYNYIYLMYPRVPNHKSVFVKKVKFIIFFIFIHVVFPGTLVYPGTRYSVFIFQIISKMIIVPIPMVASFSSSSCSSSSSS